MKFITRLWHPNVSSQTVRACAELVARCFAWHGHLHPEPTQGAICLDIIKKGPDSAWSPALTIKTALLSLQALLSAPEPNDPQDAEVAGAPPLPPHVAPGLQRATRLPPAPLRVQASTSAA